MSYTGNNPRIITSQYRPQSSDPANPLEGMVFRADGTSRGAGLWEYKNGSWQPLGAATGGLDVAFQLVGTENISTWGSGNNATFLGGGVLAGTLAYNSSTPLNSDRSYRYVQAAGSLNDYVASPAQPVALKFRGTLAAVYFNYRYDGGNSDLECVVWDVTNAQKLTVPANTLLPASSASTNLYKINVAIPLTCTSIRVGFQTKIANTAKILDFDDIVLSSDTTKFADPSTITEWQSYTPTFQGFGTPTGVQFFWRRNGTNLDVRGRFITSPTSAVEGRIGFPAGLTSVGSNSMAPLNVAGQFVTTTSTNPSQQYVLLVEPSVTYFTFGFSQTSQPLLQKQNGNSAFGGSETISIIGSVPILGYSASNPQIISASETFSSDFAALTFSSTLLTGNEPIGTYNTFTYASSSNTAVISASAPTQTALSMNTNGILLTAKNFASASGTATPARFDILIGRGYKSFPLSAAAALGKTLPFSNDFWMNGSSYSAGVRPYYNENTGVLTIEAAYADGGIPTRYVGVDTANGTLLTSGYFTINAGKTPSVVGISAPRIATLTDVKTSGTDGGTSVTNVYTTRTLNTRVDPYAVVSNFASNQFTLAAGVYYIEAQGVAVASERHRMRIRNITDSSTAILGGNSYSNGSFGGAAPAFLYGTVTLNAPKTFELQHWVQSGIAGGGFGYALSVAGETEQFATVKITKLV